MRKEDSKEFDLGRSLISGIRLNKKISKVKDFIKSKNY